MAYRVNVLRSAEGELDDIAAYLASYSERALAAFLDEYEKVIGLIEEDIVRFRLSRFPELVALGYRSAAVGDYVLLYYTEGDAAVIAHIVHGRRDYAKLIAAE